MIDGCLDAGGKVAEMDAFQHLVAESSGMIFPERFREKRDERCDQFAGRQQTLVQCPVGVLFLWGVQIILPEPIATTSDVPVAERVDEACELLTGAVVVLVVHRLRDSTDRLV